MDRKEFSKFIKKNQRWLISKTNLVHYGELTYKKINEEDIGVGDIFYNPVGSVVQYINSIYKLSLKNNTQEVEFYEFLLNTDGTVKTLRQGLADEDNFSKYSDPDYEFVYYKHLYQYVLLGNLANKHFEFMNWNENPWRVKE
jgi:hypothetical protein